MPATYTTSLRLTKPADGDINWGQTVNTGITDLVDASVAGTTTITMTAADYTLSNTNGTTDEARRMFIVATGSPGAPRNVICPAVSKLYFFRNDTAFALTLKTSGGSGVSVPAGQYMLLYCDGTNVVNAVNAFGSLTTGSLTASSLSLSTALPIASGGTGSTSTTYCSLSTNVTGTLPVTNGGTGNSTIAARSIFLANVANTLTTLTPAAGQSIRINAGNTAWEAYTPSVGDVFLSANNAFTGANTFYNATGQTFGTATSTQDGVIIAGRAGGSSSYRVTLSPTTLTASRSITLPDAAGTLVTDSAAQTLSNKTLSGPTINDGYTEEVFAVSGTTPALSPTNGSIQTWTLTGNSTPTAGTWAAGQSLTLMVDDGTAYTITWSSVSVTWKTNGGTAPALNPTGFTAIQLWKVGSTIYGARVGDA